MAKLFRPRIKLILILLAAVILLIFLHNFKITAPVENLVIWAVAPIQEKFYVLGVKINNFYNATRFGKDLLKENLELEKKVNDLTVENTQLKMTLDSQKDLVIQKNFLAEAGIRAIDAKIIGRNLIQPNFQILILNQGSSAGVKVGLPVISGNGVMVGKILAVNQNNSKMILSNDSHSSLAAIVQNQDQTKGLVVGDRGLSLKMELIPQDQLVAVGDVVVTSGLESNIPRGLVIGKIEQIISEPNSFFKQAFLEPLVNFDNLTFISILKSPTDD